MSVDTDTSQSPLWLVQKWDCTRPPPSGCPQSSKEGGDKDHKNHSRIIVKVKVRVNRSRKTGLGETGLSKSRSKAQCRTEALGPA